MNIKHKTYLAFINCNRFVVVRVAIVSLFVFGLIINPVSIIHAVGNCNVKTFGATGNGTTKDTVAIQHTIDACGGGGTVIFPSGKYLTAPLFLLKSTITLDIMSDATILGSQITSDYLKTNQKVATPTLALINAYHVNGITITGGGIIDGQGAPWWASGKSTHDRPRLIEIAYGNIISISNVTLKNAGAMHLFLKDTSNVIVNNITVQAPSNSPNTDGIDSNSSNNVLIKDCNISVGDDNIAIGSGPTPVPSYNIMIDHCQFGSGHGVSFGSGLQGGIHDVLVENSSFTGTTNGIRIKSTRTTGGKVSVVLYKNLTMTNVKNPIWFSSYYPDIPTSDAAAQPIIATTPNYSNITVSSLTATGASSSCEIVGLPEMPISALTLDAVTIAAKKGAVIRNVSGFVHSGSATQSSCLLPQGRPAAVNLSAAPHLTFVSTSSTPTPAAAIPAKITPLPAANPSPSPSTVRIS